MTKEGEFAVFCLENYKIHKHLRGAEVAEIFDRYGVFEYLRAFYDVLHTTGHNYINRDIDIYLRSRGVDEVHPLRDDDGRI